MLKDAQLPRDAARRTHRTYSAQLKAYLVAACQSSQASIAALALHPGMNANMLHRWFKEYDHGHHRLGNAVAVTGADQALSPPFFLDQVLHEITLAAIATPPSAATTTADIACARGALVVERRASVIEVTAKAIPLITIETPTSNGYNNSNCDIRGLLCFLFCFELAHQSDVFGIRDSDKVSADGVADQRVVVP